MKISIAPSSATSLTALQNLLFCATFTALLFSSCSTLVGNIKPVDEKSKHYAVEDLSNDVWAKLDPRAIAEAAGESLDPKNDAFSNEVSDVTYQSKRTAAIISLNSACRRGRNEQVNLPSFSKELTLGISPILNRDETAINAFGAPALQTTIEGKLSGEPTKIRTVVLQKSECIYDLMYISRPDKFAVHEADFTRFVSSLRAK